MKHLFFLLMLAVSMPATAGLFDSDDCDRHRESLKIGDILHISLNRRDINSDGVVSAPSSSPSVQTLVGYTEYKWGDDDKLQIKGEQIKLIEKLLEKSSIVGFYVKLSQLNKSKNEAGCFVVANFDKFDEDVEIALAKKNQCHLEFDSIPEEVGSLDKVKELGTRCHEYDPASNYSLFFKCSELQQCEENGKAALAKLDRIKAIELNQVQKKNDTRRAELLAGKIKFQSMQDVELVYQSDKLESIARSPLFTPDSKIYSNKTNYITLDAKEKNNLLRGKFIFGESAYGEVDFKYVYLRTNVKTVIFNPEKLRIGAAINVMGKYMDNVTYTTLVGAEKQAPVLDVMFIE